MMYNEVEWSREKQTIFKKLVFFLNSLSQLNYYNDEDELYIIYISIICRTKTINLIEYSYLDLNKDCLSALD